MKLYQYKERANLCGTKISKFRKQKKLTQGQLAARLQVGYNIQLTEKSISSIEKERRFIADYELLAISKVLELDIKSLYSNLTE